MSLFEIVVLGLALSADAFSVTAQAAGPVFSTRPVGLATAIRRVIALVHGRKPDTLLGDRAEILDGCVLIGIGIEAPLA